jgi:hypothetical protein
VKGGSAKGKITEKVEADGEVRITGNVQAADQHGESK